MPNKFFRDKIKVLESAVEEFSKSNKRNCLELMFYIESRVTWCTLTKTNNNYYYYYNMNATAQVIVFVKIRNLVLAEPSVLMYVLIIFTANYLDLKLHSC